MKGKRMGILIVIAVVCLLSISGYLLFNNYQIKKADREIAETIEEVKIINANSKLGMELLALNNSGEQDSGTGKESEVSDIAPGGVSVDDGQASGYYFTYAGKKRLTQIELHSADYHIFGIRVTDGIASVEKVMETYGYEEVKPLYVYDGTLTKAYKKNDVSLTFEVKEKEEKICFILLSVSSKRKNDEKYIKSSS